MRRACSALRASNFDGRRHPLFLVVFMWTCILSFLCCMNTHLRPAPAVGRSKQPLRPNSLLQSLFWQQALVEGAPGACGMRTFLCVYSVVQERSRLAVSKFPPVVKALLLPMPAVYKHLLAGLRSGPWLSYCVHVWLGKGSVLWQSWPGWCVMQLTTDIPYMQLQGQQLGVGLPTVVRCVCYYPCSCIAFIRECCMRDCSRSVCQLQISCQAGSVDWR